jgi:D-galactarolactone isomerase
MVMQRTKLRFAPPPGSCDTHIHIYEPGFPVAPTAVAGPPAAPLADYLKARAELGLSRTVVVQPTAYGGDNSCTLAAVAAMGASARGVAMIGPDVADAELARLDAGGIRGFRMRTFPGGILPLQALEAVAARVATYGWHVDLEMDGRLLADAESLLKRLPLPVVVDHIGKFMQPVPLDHPGVRTLMRLLEGGKTYVKLTAPYDSSKSGPPDYADLAPLVELLLRSAPERLVWASNWPHATLPPERRPDDAAWLDRLFDHVPDEAGRRKILVETPAAIYGFAT